MEGKRNEIGGLGLVGDVVRNVVGDYLVYHPGDQGNSKRLMNGGMKS
jgi:hypothetical protein